MSEKKPKPKAERRKGFEVEQGKAAFADLKRELRRKQHEEREAEFRAAKLRRKKRHEERMKKQT